MPEKPRSADDIERDRWLAERKRVALAAITRLQRPNCSMSQQRAF